MTKLYVKTTIFTILCLAFISLLSFFTLSTCFPSVLSNVAFNVGNKNTCLKYSEKQYEKTNSISDLDTLVYRCVWAENDSKTIKYANEMLNHPEFENYSQNKGSGYTNYVAGIYCNALYENGQKDVAINTAFQYLGKEFITPNPVSSLCYLAYKDKDLLSLESILTKLDGVEQTQSITNAKNEIKNKIDEIKNQKGEN